MEQHEFGDATPVSPPVAAQPHTVAAPPATSDDAAATSRHRFTMTVEDVASRLHIYGLDRDARTIQRWCKSGRVSAILDHENGERWLVDPATLEPVIDDIQKEISRQPKPFTSTPRRVEKNVGDAENLSRQPHDTWRENSAEHSDLRRDNLPTLDNVATTSADVGDDDAALKKRVSELELENVQLKADKQAREQLNEYMKQQFENMIETALDRTEEIGKLRAENTALLQALPAAPNVHPYQDAGETRPHENSLIEQAVHATQSSTQSIDNASDWQGTRRVY